MAILRSDEGCPWDRAQSHESIRKNLLEEALECAEAIDEKDPEHLKEELGDLLLQVVFHAQIAKEAGSFDFYDVCDRVCKKLILRHPHVFGDLSADNEESALTRWEAAKQLEHGYNSALETMQGVAKTLPGTWRMEKLLKKSEYWGESVLGDAEYSEAQLGDMVFAAIRKAKEQNIDPERMLHDACERYIEAYAEENPQ